MTLDLNRLVNLLAETTIPLRKGPEVSERLNHGIRTITIDAMPSLEEVRPEEREKLIDCHFIFVGVDEGKAQQLRPELVRILEPYAARLKDGPSYITVGAELGDQTVALCLFGLGQVLGFWKVITPKVLGIEGDLADDMAGRGLVMTSGYQP